MPRRATIRTACIRCRKKRAKCDGDEPCQRCVEAEAGEGCRYNYTRQESKDELRAEINRLKQRNEEGDIILRGFGLTEDPDAYRAVVQAFKEGVKSPDDTPKGFEPDVKSEATSSQTTDQRRALHAVSRNPGDIVVSPCFNQLLSWRSCCPSFSDSHLLGKTPEAYDTPSIIPYAPPLPLDAYTSQLHLDTWIGTGWTKAHVRHLFDALLTWDYLPFTLLSKELFLRDYNSGSSRFCSRSLVHAFLALASRLINEDIDDAGILPSGWLGSKFFFDEAESILQGIEMFTLPDIQALGVLSLYQIRCGQEAEAQEFAKAFAASIGELCRQQPLTGEPEEEQYASVRAVTYCGATFLIRMLSLVTGQLFDLPDTILETELLETKEVPGGELNTGERMNILRGDLAIEEAHNSQPFNHQLIPAKIFQLTERVHKVIMSARSTTHIASSDLVAVYTKCLGWYESFFTLLSSSSSRTPFVLFVHMYYHFCLLCAFRPYISLTLEGSDIQPRKICTQAAQSILTLAQCYEDLFSLRRVCGLVPYFVCTSGLFSLAIEDLTSHVIPMHLRQDADPSRFNNQPPGYKTTADSLGASPRIKMSAAAHAHLLLSKMGSSHPAAKIAGRMLREELQREGEMAFG